MTIDKPATLTQHAELARDIRTAEDAIGKLLRPQATRYFYARETDALIRFKERRLGLLKSRLEDAMFATFPQLDRSWIRLYFGDAGDIDALAEAIEGWKGLERGADCSQRL